MSRAFTSVNMDDIPLRNTQRINNGRANGFSQDNFLLQLFQALFNFVSSIYAFILEYMSEFSKPKTITVNSKPFRIIKQLGEGGFSFVYLVAENNGRYGESMALKKIKIQLPEHETRLLQEIACHKAVSSFHVLKLLDSEILKNNQGQAIEGRLLLPFYPQGTVQDLIDKSLYDYIPIETVLKIIIGLCRGLEAFHTHQPPLAFRDLKPANILLNADGESILMDLGSVTEAKVILNSRKDVSFLQI
jgi:serine/threonine kinase 16